MVKAIIKEIFIMLLLCTAIVLLFGIVFYEYIPINKVVPNKMTYEIPESAKEELETNVASEETTAKTLTYEINAKDLKTFVNNGTYDAGKVNPFANASTGANGTGDNTTNNNTNSSGTFYPDTGTK